MYRVQLLDKTRSTDFMFILHFNKNIDQLAMANSIRWYGHVLRKEDGHASKRALEFEVEDQRRKERP